jgi:hypothetical protein
VDWPTDPSRGPEHAPHTQVPITQLTVWSNLCRYVAVRSETKTDCQGSLWLIESPVDSLPEDARRLGYLATLATRSMTRTASEAPGQIS